MYQHLQKYFPPDAHLNKETNSTLNETTRTI